MNLESKIAQCVASCGCELYDISNVKEFGVDILRVSIYSKDGISLDKCQEVSHLISPLLDLSSPFAGKYSLEVSSPGIERVLKTPRHFSLSLGERVEVRMMDKTTIVGILQSSDDSGFVVDDKRVDYSESKRVKTLYEF